MMNARFVRDGLAAVTFVLSLGTGFAAEPIVQDFDGWKITIQPGESASISDVPPSPVATRSASSFAIRPASFQQTFGAPRLEGELPGDPVPDVDGLPIITPGESAVCPDATTIVSPPAGTVDPRYLSQMYYEIYKSIPFIRAEYNANPSYIHDTTVEFLFGKMRPTVIHRGTTTVNHNFPYGYGTPYVYGGSGYAYPPLQLVVPGTGLRIHRLN